MSGYLLYTSKYSNRGKLLRKRVPDATAKAVFVREGVEAISMDTSPTRVSRVLCGIHL